MQTAQLFLDGRNQALRLPVGFQFKGSDVYIRRVGEAVMIFPVDRQWETFLQGLNNFSPDYMAEGRDQGCEQTREVL